jgi:hypothetical protein
MESNVALKLPRFTYTGNRPVGAYKHAKQNIGLPAPGTFSTTIIPNIYICHASITFIFDGKLKSFGSACPVT